MTDSRRGRITHSSDSGPCLSRRHLLALAGASAVQAGLLQTLGVQPAGALGGTVAQAGAGAGMGERVVTEAWAGIDRLADGVWAVVSTPLTGGDWRTTSNGGIIAGGERTLVVDGFGSPEGGRWVTEQALALTGRRPTDLVVTHFHGDHVGGLEGFAGDGDDPRILMTAKTQELIEESDRQREGGPDAMRGQLVGGAEILTADRPTEIDLGGRVVRLDPLAGHTPSDVTVEAAGSGAVFCGDLVWNGLFPNYRDTTPTLFAGSIRALRARQATVWVPGHGALSDAAAVDRLLAVVDDLGEAARRAHEQGVPPADAAAAYRLPASAGDWTLFRETYFEVAYQAWYRELGKGTAKTG